ncbi:hypothetical protein ACFWYW_47015 [Nonomuraea sp. NPDC059023]|uniref:hypothetical protein n=1 Tax=unclassified Nonomuraea TaxID=2593643 RepID=UPI0036B6164A
MFYTTHGPGLMTTSDQAGHYAEMAQYATERPGGLSPDELNNVEWYGHPCGDIHGIDGHRVTCTC